MVPAAQARQELLDADLIVVGGPTHAHGMSRAGIRTGPRTRRKPASRLALDPDAESPGLRDWFASLSRLSATAAAFDTRLDGPAVFTGRASKGIRKLLARHGFTVVAEPESFLAIMRPGDADRARE